MKEALEHQALLFENYLHFWTFMVVLGLVLEYGHWIPIPWDKLSERYPGAGRIWLFGIRHGGWIEKIGGIMVVLGVAGELWAGISASSTNRQLGVLNDKLIASLNKDALVAKEQLAQAIQQIKESEERIANSNKRTAELTLANSRLQLDLEKLRFQGRPRRLTGAQSARLISTLSKTHGGFVQIRSAMLDLEAADFAEDLKLAIGASGWKTAHSRTLINPRYGVFLGTVAANGDKRLMMLHVALGLAGVDHQLNALKQGEVDVDNVIFLDVGKKPPPKD